MERVPTTLLIAFHFIFTLSYPLPAMSRPHSNLTDLESLLAFKSSVADPHGILENNWTTSASFCTWSGVRCSHKRQRVVALELPNLSLQGSVSPQVGNLSFLSYLDLSNNTLTGPIPGAIARLSRLAFITFANNSLSGTIPPAIFNMSSLLSLSFRTNKLSGSLPSNPDLFTLPRLRSVSIAQNNLTGSITPGFARCSQLQLLSLSWNKFSGNIPPELGNITGLSVLYAGRNQLAGTIPASIGNLSMLNELDLSSNYLEEFIPAELGNLLNLKKLRLDTNSLTGSIPMTLLNISDIHTLVLSENHLTGSIPNTLGVSLPRLKILSMGKNRLSGGLGFIASLSVCKNLEVLHLSKNKISDVLPDSVGNLSISLYRLDLDANYIKGRIPAGISNLSGLIELDLEANDLTGEIPVEISKLKSLQGMSLSRNRIGGHIPAELGLMKSLNALFLEDNMLSGIIPYSIGNISGLQLLSLAANRLFSNIPDSLWSLSVLTGLNLSGNSLDGSLFQQMGNLNSLDILDLSKNQLSGNISDLGKLQMLTLLDLSNNSFHGQVPSSLGRLVVIEYMNLSYNFFSGNIPKSLANLSELRTLDLSFNKLEGQIPEGGVFSNRSIISLEGNVALCGGVGFSACLSSDGAKDNSPSKLHLLKYILPPISLVIVLLSCFFTRLMLRRSTELKLSSKDTPLNDIRAISYHELVCATDNFSEANLLGRGSTSSVFKARLDDGLITAVKVLNLDNRAALRSFDAECGALSKIRHRNLVKIISVCSNFDFKALVLQFMPNGSLEKWLYSHNNYLNLLQRIDIMVDVSLALEYLHHDHPHIVVHRDLKPSNVLLDENMTAHVSDFGISKLFHSDSTDSIFSATTPGTFGYMAPEYGSTGKLSRKGDVYSFGILLLETFTRRNPSDAMFDGELSLRQWVTNAYPAAVLDIVDSNLLREYSGTPRWPNSPNYVHQCLSSLVEVGLSCSRNFPKERITMRDVIPKLRKIRVDYLSKLPRSTLK